MDVRNEFRVKCFCFHLKNLSTTRDFNGEQNYFHLTLHMLSHRYAPYPIPASAAAAAAHLSAAQHAQPHNSQPQQQQPTLATAPTVGGQNPYHPQGYGLPNVDMSSFQGVDWSSMYGMGMYV